MKAQRILWAITLGLTGIIITIACGMLAIMASMPVEQFVNLCNGW